MLLRREKEKVLKRFKKIVEKLRIQWQKSYIKAVARHSLNNDVKGAPIINANGHDNIEFGKYFVSGFIGPTMFTI